MCWSDVRIARQQSAISIKKADGGTPTGYRYDQNLRRTKLVFTATTTVASGYDTWEVNIYQGTNATTGMRLVSQSLWNPFVFDIKDFGELVTQQLYVDLIGNTTDGEITVVELQLVDPHELGTPFTEPTGGENDR